MPLMAIQEQSRLHLVLLRRNGIIALPAVEVAGANIAMEQVDINTQKMGNAIRVTEQEMGSVPDVKEKVDGISNKPVNL